MNKFEPTWQDSIAAIHYEAVELPDSVEGKRKVKLRSDHAVVVAFGYGDTVEDAINSGTNRLPWDFYSIRQKIKKDRMEKHDKMLSDECDSICHF